MAIDKQPTETSIVGRVPWEVLSWCHQGADDDRYGLCDWAGCGNVMVSMGLPVMPNAEIENAARVMEGFDPYKPETDHGEVLETVIKYWCDYGWPGDETLKPDGYRAITVDEIAAALANCEGVLAALMLPMRADGSDYDFSDDAVERGAAGVYGHAVCMVSPETFISWARPIAASGAWLAKYVRQVFAVRLELPRESVNPPVA